LQVRQIIVPAVLSWGNVIDLYGSFVGGNAAQLGKLGTMGAGMAANLQKAGYKLVAHDIRQDSASPHLNAGAKWADSHSLSPEPARDHG